MPRGLNQKALARQLGVSVATVSRVLNDRPGVSPEVRERVLKALAESGYIPNGAARTLATARTHTIAFVVHQAHHTTREDPFYPFIVAGAESYLASRQYHVLFTSVGEDLLERPHEFSAVAERRVDGLIIAGPDIAPGFIAYHLSQKVPLVLIDNCLQNIPVNCVLNDDFTGEYEATTHLLRKGRQRIVFLSGPQAWISSRERARGYAQAMQDHHLSPSILYAEETTILSGEQLMRAALDQWPDLDAVCAANDAMAIGAIRALSRQGRRVPEDVAVIGFDDIAWAAINEPPLSTVHIYKRRLGMLAAQRILELIEDPETPPVKILASTELVLRASSGD